MSIPERPPPWKPAGNGLWWYEVERSTLPGGQLSVKAHRSDGREVRVLIPARNAFDAGVAEAVGQAFATLKPKPPPNL